MSHSAPRGSAAAAAAGEKLCVLHVDDDPNDTALFRAAARKAEVPFSLHCVHDGEQAIAYLNSVGASQTAGPKLILLDWKLPRVNGLDLLRWIRTQAALRCVPVVVLSGSQSEIDQNGAYAAGADGFVEKPFGFEPLVDLVRTLHHSWLRPQSGL